MTEQFLSRGEQFFVDSLNVGNLFRVVNRMDYTYLYCIKLIQDHTESDKVYFPQIAEKMQQDIPAVSKAMNRLKQEGYIIWKVDDSSDRTYVSLTDAAAELIVEQRRKLIEAFKELEEEVGEEELKAALHVMQRIRAISQHVYAKDTVARPE